MSNYMLENDIPSVHDDESSDCEELPKYEESPACDFTVYQICKENNITVQYAHDFSTGNMLDHPEKTITNGSIVKAMHVITRSRQEKIAQLLVEFIIKDCQPFYILQSKAFRHLLNYIETGFRIPCEQTVKKMINKAYEW
ncbi:19179_t:CDS:2, partial [Gigaspora margarita]